MSTNLSRKTFVTIGPNEYEINYPNVGQQLDIEILKLQISGDKYDTMKFSYNPVFFKQIERIDAIATFSTLIPSLKKDLTVKSLLELSDEQFETITKAYSETYLPWYDEWQVKLSTPKEEVKKEELKVENK